MTEVGFFVRKKNGKLLISHIFLWIKEKKRGVSYLKSLWPLIQIRQAAVQDCPHSDGTGQPGLLGLRLLGWRVSGLIAFHETDLIEEVCNGLRYLSVKGGCKGNSRGCVNSNICNLLHSRDAGTTCRAESRFGFKRPRCVPSVSLLHFASSFFLVLY